MKAREFYDWWSIEYEIRSKAAKFKNVYIAALFGCCREIYNKQKHSGYVGGTLLQGLVQFDKAEHQAQNDAAREKTEEELRKEFEIWKQN